MAKWEDADTRWIVQDREDGRNVNNWHWTEKDCMEWSKSRLNELFSGRQLLTGQRGCTVAAHGIETVTGEAFLNVRKGKLIPSYELDVKIKWQGEVLSSAGSSSVVSGKLHFPYLADENHDEAVELKVLCDTASAEVDLAKETLLSHARQDITALLQQFVEELRAGGPDRKGAKPTPSSTPAAPAAATSNSPAAPSSAPSAPAISAAPAPNKAAPAASALSSSGRGHTHRLSLTERFYARPVDLWECFVVEGRVGAYTQSKASIDARPGGKFSWFGGSLQGEFVEMVAPTRLVMRWRFNNWEDDCFSRVELKMDEPEPGNTILTLVQEGIPHEDKYGNRDVLTVTEAGWKNQVLRRIKAVFGYGA